MVRFVTAVPMGTPGRSLAVRLGPLKKITLRDLRHRDIDAEDGRVGHPMQRDEGAIEIGHRDHKAGAGADRQSNHGARGVGLRDDCVDDLLHFAA